MGPQDIDPLMEAKYRTMSQMGAVRPGGVGVGLGALATEQNRADRVAVDPFAGMKAGENRTFQSFNANQVGVPGGGGMTVVSGTPSSLGMMQSLRTQGYTADEAAKLVGVGTEADLAKTRTRLLPEEAAAQNKLTLAQALQSGALTNKTNVEASLLPEDVRSQIALRGKQGNLLGEQAAWFGPTAKAGIGLTNAQALDVGTQNPASSFLPPEQPKKLFSQWKFGLGLR